MPSFGGSPLGARRVLDYDMGGPMQGQGMGGMQQGMGGMQQQGMGGMGGMPQQPGMQPGMQPPGMAQQAWPQP